MILTPEILENKQVRHLAAVISVMCSDKERNYSFADYAKNHDADSNGHISENHLQDYEHSQQLLITWCFKVVDRFTIQREIVSITMSFVDRFISAHHQFSNHKALKLVTVSALHLAVKVHEPQMLHKLGILPVLSKGEFQMEHIIRMELLILQSLAWRLYPPTTLSFIMHFMELLKFSLPHSASHLSAEDVVEVASFFSELEVFDYTLASVKPSLVAFAAILNAMEHLSSVVRSGACGTCERSIECLTSFFPLLADDREQLEAIRSRLWMLYDGAGGFASCETGLSASIPRRSPVSITAALR